MAVNLRARLKQRGLLIVCRTDDHDVTHGTVFRLNEANRFEVVSRIRDGSEIENLILDLPGVSSASSGGAQAAAHDRHATRSTPRAARSRTS
jgi:hypothetical protein